MTSIVDMVKGAVAALEAERLAASKAEDELAAVKNAEMTVKIMTDVGLLNADSQYRVEKGVVYIEGYGYQFYYRGSMSVLVLEVWRGENVESSHVYYGRYHNGLKETILENMAELYGRIENAINPPPPEPPPPPPQLVKFEAFPFGESGERELSSLLAKGWKIKKISDPVSGYDGDIVYATLVRKE